MTSSSVDQANTAPLLCRSHTDDQHELTHLRVTLSPAFDRYGRRRPEQFEARLCGCADVLCVARQPLLEVARILLSQGKSPKTVLALVHAGDELTVSLRAEIGIAAQFDVLGSRFVRRKVGPTAMPRPLAASTPFLDPDGTQTAGVDQRARHKANAKSEGNSRLKSSPSISASKRLHRGG
jgi:hypothetical protein